jgi:hypothetical protein
MKRFNLALATRDVHEQPPDPWHPFSTAGLIEDD